MIVFKVCMHTRTHTHTYTHTHAHTHTHTHKLPLRDPQLFSTGIISHIHDLVSVDWVYSLYIQDVKSACVFN